MAIITFTHPQFLFLMALVPVLIILHFFLLKTKRTDAIKFANFDAIARIRGVDLYSKNLIIVSLTGITTILVVLSLSGLNIQRDVSSSVHSFVIAIDSSESMSANDILPTRIDAARDAAKTFVDLTPPGTRMAVISYSGNAFIEQELTDEKPLIKNGLNVIELSTIGGTDPAEAIIAGTNVLSLEDGKAMILMSDGRINVGNLDEALAYATKNNVIIHTIGIGTEEGGQASYGLSTIEEDSLRAAAFTTGGQYFRVSTIETLEDSFNKIIEFKRKRVSFDLSRSLLAFSLVLILLQYILVNTKYRTYP